MRTVRVADLKTGDQLSNCVIIAPPAFIGNYLGSKNRMAVRVRFSDGTESTRIWGKFTTVTVKA